MIKRNTGRSSGYASRECLGKGAAVWGRSGDRINILPAVLLWLIGTGGLLAQSVRLDPASFPPRLPQGQLVVYDQSEKMLVPADTLLPGVQVAKTPPRVSLHFIPDRIIPEIHGRIGETERSAKANTIRPSATIADLMEMLSYLNMTPKPYLKRSFFASWSI
ncbi:MAG: hypothetical protein KatS3mg109_1918 [Pirellulaceae bacterium]|nr:MAG: hypothetical protein KatS3mg109_1918 [Pirellulaceae bacterium]